MNSVTTNKDNVVNSPMARLAKVYQGIESTLRTAAMKKVPVSLLDVQADKLVNENHTSTVQIRGILDTLTQKGYVIKSRDKDGVKFLWNLDAQPFVFQVRKARGSALKQPSKPQVVKLPKQYPEGKPYQYYIDEMNKLTDEYKQQVRERARKEGLSMEVEFEGALITLSRDPETGRVRVKVQDILS